jgi:hypothetical protein
MSFREEDPGQFDLVAHQICQQLGRKAIVFGFFQGI